MSTIEDVYNLICEPLKSKGISVYEITFQKESGDLILRILVEKMDGLSITLDEIVEVSEEVSTLLDEQDVIKEDNYTLDVASVGAEHPIKLEQLDNYVGKYINIHLINPIKGLNILEGTLDNIDESLVYLTVRDKTRNNHLEIKRSDIDRARLAIKF